jgi:hypothetical protein
MHHRSYCLSAKWVNANPVRTQYPPPTVRVLEILYDGPTHFRRPEVFHSEFYCFGDATWEKAAVRLVSVTPQRPYNGRGGMGMRRRDQHAVSRNAGRFLRQPFGFVEKVSGHQAVIYYHNRNAGAAVVEYQAPAM